MNELRARLVEHAERLRLMRLDEGAKNSGFRGSDYTATEASFRRRMFNALRAFERGDIGADELARRWDNAINTLYPRAYAAGAQAAGGLKSPDPEFLARAIASEQHYAQRFAQQLGGGNMSPKQAASRLEQYVLGLDSVKINGWMRNNPDEGVLYNWNLGVAEHCPDCLILAGNSPYAPDELPTVPRGGSTCLVSPDARILTARGQVPIEYVRIGDYVWTHLGRWREITAVHRTASEIGRRFYNFTSIGDGEILHGRAEWKITTDHLVWCKEGPWSGWVELRRVHPMAVAAVCHGVAVCEGDHVCNEGTLLDPGTTLYDLEVNEDHSFICEGLTVHNSCRSRCKCFLTLEPAPRRGGRVQSEPVSPRVTSATPDFASGSKQGREPSKEERARVDDVRSRMNYWRREIERADTDEARNRAIRERRQANRELVNYEQTRGIRSIPMRSVGEVITDRQISANAARGLSMRGIDGTEISFADAAKWRTERASLMAELRDIING